MKLDALVLLGCRIGPYGRPSTTAVWRADRAAEAWREGLAPWIVVSGGRHWHGVSEADALADYLVQHGGVPRAAILPERRSLSTTENAWYSARLLKDRGLLHVGVVTSDWHITRALGAFRRVGQSCDPVPALSPPVRWWFRAYRWVREVVSHQLGRWFARGRP